MNIISPPSPDPDELRDNAVFDAVMWAVARPGSKTRLPEPGGLLLIALAFVDMETRVYCDNADLQDRLSYADASHTLLSEADHIFLTGSLTSPLVEAVPKGSALYPDGGATVAIAVSLDGGNPLRLTGPGIEVAHNIAPAVSTEIWATRARAEYPAGFELILVDGRDVIVLPRSTRVEVL